ncbi:MAG: ExeM/NucH family extracellular endonuclease [Chloroflexota bacterium]
MINKHSSVGKRNLSRGLKLTAVMLIAFFVFVSQASAADTTSVLAGGITINEVLADPNGANNFDTDGDGTAETDDEFVEIYNLSGSTIDIGGFELWDAGADLWFTFPSGTMLGAGNYAVVVGDIADGSLPAVSAGNLAFSSGSANGINNGGDNVVLYDPNNDEYIQIIFNGDAVDDPTAAGDYDGFSVTATLVGTVDDFGSDSDGISLVREPAGDTNVVQHNTISADNASPGDPTNTVVADAAPEVAGSTPADGATGVAVDADITIDFSEDVVAAAGWFDITCSTSGAVTAVESGGPSSYVLNPDTDFANSESCTVTVVAANVTDSDTNDPPDNMDADATFSFTVADAAPPAGSDLIITGLIDGPLTGGIPKGVELYVSNDIADLSIYGLGSANNGGGTDGEEFTFPADSATAGEFIYVASETDGFTDFFGFAPDYTSGSMAINGDDAVELFQNGAVVDIFGDINTDGTGEPWEHLDGWAYRVNGTGPDGATFILANWTFSGPNALDGESDNATAATPFPIGTYAPPAPPLILTAVFDGPLTGGVPKGVELFVGQNIADLSIYGLGSANNGGGTDGEEFTFPADSATAGDYIYVASEIDGFTDFFGFAPDYTSGSMAINGDDAVELFENGAVIDVFGDINTDGTGEPWEHLDGWAYRVDGTGPDGSTFVLANWTFSGPNALDGESDNATAATPVPIGTYTFSGGGGGDAAPTVTSTTPADGASLVALDANIDITFSEDVTVTGTWFDINCSVSGANTAVVSGGPTAFTLNPDSDFASNDSCTVTVFASGVADQDGTADNMAADFSFSFDTVVTETCGDPFTPIYDIQGSGLASALDGSVVSTEGVVTATFYGVDEIGGFFIQDAAGDGDASTSDGIYVFTTIFTDPVVGDKVRVTGEVDEFFDLTEITNVSAVTVCGPETPIAATNVTLPVASVDDLEAYEGMLITFSQELTVTDSFNVHRFGEVVVSANGRQINQTNANAPGAIGEDNNGNSVQDVNEPGRLLIDDGSSAQFPATIPYLAPDNTIRLGDTTTDLTGVLSYGFNFYRLQPTESVDFVRTNPRPTAPTDFGADITVASVNVLNYFVTIDDGNNSARGADSAAEFVRQQAKLVDAILTIDADVVGLQEIQNDGTVSIANLVDALNAATSPGTWDYIVDPIYNGDPNGIQATNAIKVGIIYQTASVTPVGASVADEDPVFSEDRPPVAQTFDANGEVFTVIVNHFKSKGCSGATGLDMDQNDGQGCYNERRTDMSVALLDFVTTMQSISGDDDVIVLGDMNAYAEEDPITTLETGLINQVDNYVALEDKYSFTFFGQSGQLDHMFTTASLDASVVGAEIYHISTDEPRVLSYNDEIIDPAEGSSNLEQDYVYVADQYRASDHDPVILSLKFEEPGPPTNDDGCYVLALYGSPFTGEATMVNYLFGNYFYAQIWEADNNIPAGSCYEIHGTNYADRIYGNFGDDVIFTYAGNDTLVGRGGDDVFTTGTGWDRVFGGNGYDTVTDFEFGRDRCRQVENGC